MLSYTPGFAVALRESGTDDDALSFEGIKDTVMLFTMGHSKRCWWTSGFRY